VLGGYQKWKLITRGSQRYVTLALRIKKKKEPVLIYDYGSQKSDN
jgi:hypothetical protein